MADIFRMPGPPDKAPPISSLTNWPCLCMNSWMFFALSGDSHHVHINYADFKAYDLISIGTEGKKAKGIEY